MALNPDVIFTSTTPAIKALQQETRTIPLIFVEVSDPTGAGVVASLARPGGNTTGLLFYEDSILGKWLQFILGNIGTHAYNQTLYKKPLYDARNDFAPVGLIGFGFYVLVVRNDLPVNSLSEFIAYAKANQGKMQYGSGGAGSATHISCVLLNQAIGTNITHIPYRGAGPALQELMGGRLDFMCDAIQTSLPHIQAGTVKAIATLSEQRTPLLPDLPTAQQQGLTEFAVYGWSAAFFPKGIDQAMVRRLNAAIGEVLDTQSVRERFEALGYKLAAPEQRSPDYLAKFVASEIEKWAGPIKLSGVSMD